MKRVSTIGEKWLSRGIWDQLVRAREAGSVSARVPHAPSTRRRSRSSLAYAGEETARYLWDKHVSAVCADNPAVEQIPGAPSIGFLHRRLIPMLGFTIGELFTFESLAADCAADGRYTCLFIGVPLNIPGGVGSPANAIAIK